MSTWKSYPTLGDMSLWAGLLSCYPDYVASTYSQSLISFSDKVS